MITRHKIPFVLGLVLSSLAFSVAAHAQYNGNIQGVILDPAGAAVANATVILTNQENGISQQIKSSGSGNYRFSSLEPGPYLVRVSAAGFDDSQVNTNLETSQTLAVNVSLKVKTANESVTVTTSGPILDIDENRLETTIPSQEVVNLPELNRNTWDTLTVAPGITGTGTRAAGESPGGGADNFGTQTVAVSANGRSYTGNLVMVDGMNVTSPVQNGNIVLSPIQDSVEAVSIQANSWDAENALGSSILVQVTTKSGTNKYHGTGALFWNNQDLNANQELSGPTTPYSRKDLSSTFGGPVIKDKTFFFADFEKLWATVAEALSGVQTWEDPAFVSWAKTVFPNTVGTQVLTGWPVTYAKSAGVKETAAQYFGTSCGTSATDNIPCSTPMLDSGTFNTSPYYNALQYNFRLDEYFTKNDRFYLAYYNDSFAQQQPAIRAGLTVVNFQANRYGQADYTHTFSPKVLAEGSFAFASVGGANGQLGDLKVPNINVTGQSEGITSGGWGPGEYRGPEYNWRGVLSAEINKHTLKFGVNGVHGIEHGDFTPVSVRPTFQFNNLLDLVTDQPFNETGVSLNPSNGQAGKVVFGGQENPVGFFAQDDWKMKSNLSLTLALRWDYYSNHTPWGNSGFKFSNMLLGTSGNFAQQVASATVTPVSAVFASSITNLWSPRIGFSWDPSRRGTWTVRGGIGVYHDWVALGQSVDEMRLNPPSLITPVFSVQTPSLPAPLFALAPSGTYPFNFPLPALNAAQLASLGGGIASVVAMDRNFKAPYAVNYVAGVEHELPHQYVVGASYAGSGGYDQLTGTDENRFAGSLIKNNGALVRLNPNYGSINYVDNANQSTYNALIVTFRGTPAESTHFQGSYMFSKVENYPEAGTRFDQDTGLGIPDPTQYFSYRGPANWDVRNRFSLSGAYTVAGMHAGPGKIVTGGWEFTSIAILQTGTPYWVYNTLPYSPFTQNGATYTEGDYNADGNAWDIPNTPTNNAQFTGSHSRSTYKNGVFSRANFECTNPSAATCKPGSGGGPGVLLDLLPTPGTEGNEPRNLYRNPGMIQWDASLIKNNPIERLGPGGNLQLRFDFLNLPNHVNLSTVDPNMADGTFGQVTSALQARQLQFGVRVAF
jgi:Carboxypeptidase regulatory-like domain